MAINDFNGFVSYVNKYIKGDEKGEAQVFLDHFFQALGYEDGFKGAGASCEFRIRDEQKNSTKFADLVWKPVVLIEMKKRGEDLTTHYQQAFSYWSQLVPNRPQYVILCNFDEFWIYDLNLRVYEPLEKIAIDQLTERQEAFGFLFPKPRKPLFNYNKEDVTEKAAYYVSHTYRSMLKRKIEPLIALKYCLQLVLTMFAEDVDLLPNHVFTRILTDLENEPGDGPDTISKSYDLIGGLFQAMNTEGITDGGMYKGVEYFNGGLFDKIYPIELTKHEITLIKQAAHFNWRHVNPAIFGSIFEEALDVDERHKLGAHYTHELDIKKIVDPVIIQPWNERIDRASTPEEYYALLTELAQFKVLDPACGSGNFLFIAFKEMKLLEKKLLRLVRDHATRRGDDKRLMAFLKDYAFVNTSQFYGIDIKPFAMELAKVTLMIAKELTWLEAKEDHDNKYKPLPLDNLDSNIRCHDALVNEDGTPYQWPDAEVIIGNPPYQSKNKMQKEFGVDYLNKLRSAYPEVPGRADFCVYWFYKAHQHLKPGHFAGLVGTNTIRQNYSREGSLDYIVKNGGTIINAVSSEDWSGAAAVFVSIVSWTKGNFTGEKLLYALNTDNQMQSHKLAAINSSLSLKIDVTSAQVLQCNREPKKVFQGQTHGHEGFLMPKDKALQLLKQHSEYEEVLKPYLIGDELVSNIKSQPERFIVDFTFKDLIQASTYKLLFEKIQKEVLPFIEQKAKEEELGISKANGRKAQLEIWWKLWRRREELLKILGTLNRYIVCARVTKRPIFEFVSSDLRPSDVVMAFTLEDDYSFGIIASNLHWKWFVEKCSTLGEQFRYTTDTIWDTFPWPQHPTNKQVEAVAKAAKTLRDARNLAMQQNKLSLRDLYRTLEKPGKNPIKDLHATLDNAVTEAYGFDKNADLLQQLLDLNLQVSEAEQKGEKVQKPGVPDGYPDAKKLVSEDCVRFEG